MLQSSHVNGIELFFRDSGSGEPLLLLHGFTGSGEDWQHVFAEPLAGYRLIAPDLRGHGRSTNPGGQFTFATPRATFLRSSISSASAASAPSG